ncbi:uncharacterized protein LOC143159934 isoform X2 [Aptenodytes patagonicus]|uniref:uncharacterized protein LOC143159934 isoform X2 n=1 Tax=Aptenodytes patagonicus TaxID=9234 RepID=UPI003F9EFF3E
MVEDSQATRVTEEEGRREGERSVRTGKFSWQRRERALRLSLFSPPLSFSPYLFLSAPQSFSLVFFFSFCHPSLFVCDLLCCSLLSLPLSSSLFLSLPLSSSLFLSLPLSSSLFLSLPLSSSSYLLSYLSLFLCLECFFLHLCPAPCPFSFILSSILPLTFLSVYLRTTACLAISPCPARCPVIPLCPAPWPFFSSCSPSLFFLSPSLYPDLSPSSFPSVPLACSLSFSLPPSFLIPLIQFLSQSVCSAPCPSFSLSSLLSCSSSPYFLSSFLCPAPHSSLSFSIHLYADPHPSLPPSLSPSLSVVILASLVVSPFLCPAPHP